jgi:transposase InsO family protein
MDFIMKLPKSRDPISGKEYDSILIITDRLIKEAKFALINEATDAPGTAYLVVQNVVATEGLPNEWITNRDPKFMSHFWQTLIARLGVKHNTSTAYHPQTNGQNERLN